MEKKRYYKPEVKKTKMDYSINIQLISENTPPPTPPPEPTGLGGENPVVNGFINPLKWFK